MMTFRNQRLRNFSVPMSTTWLLNDLAEAKGKQEFYTGHSPQTLQAEQLFLQMEKKAFHKYVQMKLKLAIRESWVQSGAICNLKNYVHGIKLAFDNYATFRILLSHDDLSKPTPA